MVELFGHIRMIYERDKPRLALEAAFPKSVTPFLGDPDKFISEILEPIGDSAVLLADNGLVITQFGPVAAKAVRSLERIDNKDWMPPVLLRLWKRKPGDGPAIEDFLLRLERLAYFMFVCRYGINDRIARFAMVMDEIDPLLGRERPVHGLELTAAEQAQFIEALEGPLYPKSRVCKPVLQRLDEALSAGGASYDSLVSIEHVLPQTVAEGSEWSVLFPDQSQRNYWTHRIANLVFLTKRINNRASNWDFEKKKKEYFVSKDGTAPFPLTQSVLQADKWSIEHLVGRQAQLIAKLKEVWKLESKNELPGLDPADPNESDMAGQTGRELNEKWGIGAQHTLYRKDGTWYHRLERFPGALCDKNGYVLFKTPRDLQTCPGISIGKEKNWISVPGGIASLPGYRRAEP
jgi:hypothetical protein